MTNVVLVGNFLFPSGSASAMRIQNMAKGLAENGAKVHVLPIAPIFAPDKTTDQIYHLTPNITYELLAITSSPLLARNPLRQKPIWLWRTYTAAIKAYKRMRQLIKTGQCDLLIGYGRNMALLGPLLRLCQTHRIVTLLDVVELRSQFSGFGGKLNPIYWDWYLGEQVLPRWFDGLIVIAQGLQPIYAAVGVTKFLQIPSIEGWDDLPPILEKDNREKQPFQLVCLTTLIKRDAPHVLLETMRLLGQQNIHVQLNLLGKFREVAEARPWIELCETDPYLRQNVRLVGKVSDAELEQYFSLADGLVLTRRDAITEVCSFPTRLVEYLKTGRPVFVSAVGDIPNYLQNGQDAILLSPEDPGQAAQAIATIVATPKQGWQIGLQGRNKGSLVFDRKEHTLQLLQFAAKLMREKNGVV